MFKIKIILGSTRQERFGDKPAKWIFDLAFKNPEIEAELLDLRDYLMPFYNAPFSPSTVKDGNYASEVARKFAQKIKEADGFIIVSPEYNHGAPAVLKNALDNVYQEWNNKPVGFVSYGTVGGARAVEQLRLIAIELQMAPIRQAIHIPRPWDLLDESGNLKEGAFDQFEKPAQNFLSQLIWWANALKLARHE